MSSKHTNRRSNRALEAWDVLGYPVELVVKHFEKRLFELAMAIAMLGEGLLLLFSPQSIVISDFQFLLESMSLPSCVLLFLSIGVARIVALGLNGHWMPYGGYVRAVGAGVGAFMWVQMDVALWLFSKREGIPLPPGFPVFAVLSQFEIVSIYRALAGVRRWQAHGSTD